MMFIVDSYDLNTDVFNESTGYHVLLDYGPHGGYLKRLQSEVRGFMFHSFQMTRSRLSIDLEDALMFQKNFAQVVCSALDTRFCDNDLISCFKILIPTNMPSGQVGLQNWCISELDILLCHYGVDRLHGSFKLPHFMDQTTCKLEFLVLRLQCTTEWGDKNFRGLWGMITWNHVLQARYPNLLILAEVAHVQCVSIATCGVLSMCRI